MSVTVRVGEPPGNVSRNTVCPARPMFIAFWFGWRAARPMPA